MRTQVMVALGALVVVCASSGCGAVSEGPSCSRDNCRGCCDADGVCQPGTAGDACGASGFACNVCGLGTSCQAFGQCLPTPQPPPVDGGRDAGVESDAGLPPNDAGLEGDAGVVDAGLDCGGTWVTNPGFECGLRGWVVLEGQGRSTASAWQGAAALELTADERGFARVAVAQPIAVTGNATLCVAVNARGNVPNVRVEVLVSPSNVGTAFAAPVLASWSRVPPSMLAVPVQAGSQAYVMVRASGASAGQVLELDEVEVRFSTSPTCAN